MSLAPQAFALHTQTTNPNRHTCMHINKINFENNENAYLFYFEISIYAESLNFTTPQLILKFI